MSIDFILPRLLRGCGSRLEDYARQASAQGCPKLKEDFFGARAAVAILGAQL
jgi:hypothetical protein